MSIRISGEDVVIDLRVSVDANTVDIESKEAGFTQNISNTILIDTASNKIYSIGRTADEIAKDSPEIWANRSVTMSFFTIFNSEEFNEAHTEAALRFYLSAIHHEARTFWGVFFFGWLDQFILTLEFERYEQVGETEKKRFEDWILRGTGKHIKSLVINGSKIDTTSNSR
ncbi:hypothetical protein KFU94_16525 [Chloroflexi bacterium TSY]|nr:hypothetical protein [Chloroflexi bacterium TSY]